MVEVCGIEPQSKNSHITASTRLVEVKNSPSLAHFPKTISQAKTKFHFTARQTAKLHYLKGCSPIWIDSITK